MAMQQAPDFTLDHVTGRKVSLSEFRGKPAVVLFSGRESKDQAGQIEAAVRSKYHADEVAVVAVADVKGVPRLLRGVAKSDIDKAYKKSAQDVTKDLQARGKVVPDDLSLLAPFLLDWEGQAVAAYGADGAGKQAVVVVVDANGSIKGRAAGSEAVQQISTLLG